MYRNSKSPTSENYLVRLAAALASAILCFSLFITSSGSTFRIARWGVWALCLFLFSIEILSVYRLERPFFYKFQQGLNRVFGYAAFSVLGWGMFDTRFLVAAFELFLVLVFPLMLVPREKNRREIMTTDFRTDPAEAVTISIFCFLGHFVLQGLATALGLP